MALKYMFATILPCFEWEVDMVSPEKKNKDIQKNEKC